MKFLIFACKGNDNKTKWFDVWFCDTLVFSGKQWHTVGTIINTKVNVFVERRQIAEELNDMFVREGGNYVIAAPRQVGKSTQAWRAMIYSLSNNIPVLYCVFRVSNGGSNMRDPAKLYQYIMRSIHHNIIILGSNYKITGWLRDN